MEVSNLLNPLQKSVKPSRELFRAFLAEMLAMCIFVFMGCGSVTSTGAFLVDDAKLGLKTSVARVLPIATTFGLSIVVLAFGIGPISGGHINPAVTFSLFLVRKISLARCLIYWAAQALGSIMGALLLWGAISGSSWEPGPGTVIPGFRPGIDVVPAVGRPPFRLGANQLNPVLNTGNGLLLEIMGTAMLVGTVLSTAVDNRSLGKIGNLAPLPIGISVWVVHLALIPWTGCGINPARTFGPAFVNSWAGLDVWQGWWWIYYVGPMFGSIFATMVMCVLWGGRRPPKAASTAKKAQVEEIGGTTSARADVDLDAITI